MMNITLAHTLTESQSLKTLLNTQSDNAVLPAHVAATITIAPNTAVTLEDDLIAFHELGTTSLIKHTLTFVVLENSTLHYRMRVVPAEQAVSSTSATTIEKSISLKLAGKHAQAYVVCSCFGSGNNIFKFNTLQDHQVEETTSNLLVKGVLDDASKLICNSMITIQKDAQHTNAEQANKNILLSKKARAVSIPQLEIEANDVKCKHGAAVSQLNKDHMFYLQSRGLDATLTKRMLIEAFLS